MNRHDTVPEYIVEELQETHPMVNGPPPTNIDYLEVRAELALLSQELTRLGDTLERIRDSVLVLVQSVQEPL